MNDRIKEFDAALLAVIKQYEDVPRGTRGMILYTAFAALLMAEKGSALSIVELNSMIANFNGRLVGSGVLARHIPRKGSN